MAVCHGGRRNRMEQLEEMSRFFDQRIGTYEEHMLEEVKGAREAYVEIAKYIPVKENIRLVDLGCGTGLELREIYRKNPSMKVTGIDLSREMLHKLKDNYPDKQIEVHNMSYLDYDYGLGQYDAAVSCETLHHLSHDEKLQLYTKLYHGLASDGRYVECDYMVQDQKEEDYYYAENERIRKELGIQEGIYHYDTPCTIENQIKLLQAAGFTSVEKKMHVGNTVMLVCDK
jgi:cyclopropane fatty-acyl-phospholipid synthase-like methyltransferase